MKKMKKLFNDNEILLSSQYNPVNEEFQEMGKEDREMYLFMRGGFAAK
ncbi:MAG: hypothetical protein WA130_18825 [Candidatus Methanoperedens sp.]